jgi:hypothetical protein
MRTHEHCCQLVKCVAHYNRRDGTVPRLKRAFTLERWRFENAVHRLNGTRNQQTPKCNLWCGCKTNILSDIKQYFVSLYYFTKPISRAFQTSNTAYSISEFWFGAGIAQWYSAGLRDGWSGVRVPAEAGNFSLHNIVQTGSGAHPSSYPGSFLGVKRPGRDADHSPPSSAEVEKAWRYTSTPPIRLHAVVLG